MFNKNFKFLFAAILIVGVSIGGAFFVQHLSKPKTGYIEIKQVYEKFNLKIELENKFLMVQQAREHIIDSMLIELQVLENNKKEQPGNMQLQSQYDVLRDDIIRKKQMFDEDNTRLTTEYDTQILTQLNQYIHDFGKAHDYQYIFGANGSGDVLYAKEDQNLTELMISYINERYAGKNE